MTGRDTENTAIGDDTGDETSYPGNSEPAGETSEIIKGVIDGTSGDDIEFRYEITVVTGARARDLAMGADLLG
jgi:hypothetical protein